MTKDELKLKKINKTKISQMYAENTIEIGDISKKIKKIQKLKTKNSLNCNVRKIFFKCFYRIQ